MAPFSETEQAQLYPELVKLANAADDVVIKQPDGTVHIQSPDPVDGQGGYDARNDVYLAEDGKKHWGFHLMMDMGACNASIAHPGAIHDFLVKLVTAIGMSPVGQPMIYTFNEGVEGGVSAIQMITTSNISLHGDNWNASMYLDIFSCKPFNKEAAIRMAKEQFTPKDANIRFLYRDSPTKQTGDTHAVGSN